MADLRYLEGKKFCIVFAKQADETNNPEKMQLRCMHGRANIEGGKKLSVESGNGAAFAVPSSAYSQILPSDGTDLLKDSEYFVIVKVSSNMEL